MWHILDDRVSGLTGNIAFTVTRYGAKARVDPLDTPESTFDLEQWRLQQHRPLCVPGMIQISVGLAMQGVARLGPLVLPVLLGSQRLSIDS